MEERIVKEKKVKMPNPAIDITQTKEYREGYCKGFMEGRNTTFETFKQQLEEAYLLRPIVIKIK